MWAVMRNKKIRWNELGHYVYAYIDPRNNDVFYIGKGKGSRALAHLSDRKESDKTERIAELSKLGLEPRIELIRHSLKTNQEAEVIESSCIDAIGVNNLTNEIKGKGSRSFGRKTLEEVFSTIASDDIEITDPVLLVRIPKTFYYGIKDVELYENTRGTWNRLPKNYNNARFALAVYDHVVQEVYEIAGWFQAGETQYFTRGLGESTDLIQNTDSSRMEFVGRIAKSEVRSRYKYKSILNTVSRSYGHSITGVNL